MTEVGVVLAVVVGAAVLGAVYRVRSIRRLGDRDTDDARAVAEGVNMGELSSPLLTLVALLLAFVLVQTFSSFQEASDNAVREAGAVVAEGQAARLLSPGSASKVIGALQCYARAVAGPGWEALESTRVTSPITEEASARVGESLLEARAVPDDQQALDTVLNADAARLDARARRLSEALHSVPVSVTLLLVVSVAIVLGGLAALTSRRARLAYALPVLAATVFIFAGTLVVIVDLDRPFGGLARIEPIEMREAERTLAGMPEAMPPPCDDDGAPVPT